MKFLEILLKVKGNTKYYRELREWKHEEKTKREHGGYMIWLDDLSPQDNALVNILLYDQLLFTMNPKQGIYKVYKAKLAQIEIYTKLGFLSHYIIN